MAGEFKKYAFWEFVPGPTRRFVDRLCFIVIVLLISVTALMHFYKLDKVPYGLHGDEAAASVTIGCMVTEGIDACNQSWPLFGKIGGVETSKPPTYMYPAIIWAKLFGYSVPSLRCFSVAVYLLGLMGLFFLAKDLFSVRYALWTLLVASLSPWAWGLSRLALESFPSNIFLIWGMYFLFKSNRNWSVCLAGTLFSFAMYAYPAMRLQVPLMLWPLVHFLHKKNKIDVKAFVVCMSVVMIVSGPLIYEMINGLMRDRFEASTIFSGQPLHFAAQSMAEKIVTIKNVSVAFAHNYFLHLSPSFLLFEGDSTYAFSTKHFGILGWLDMAAFVFGLFFIGLLLFRKSRINNPFIYEKHY